MAEVARLQGSLTSTPTYLPNGQARVTIPLDESLSCANSLSTTANLTTDDPYTLSLGPLANVNVLMIRATGGKIRVRVTSSDGSQQSIPTDFLLLYTRTVSITAVDLTRTAGTSTVVSVYMGDKA